MAGNRSNSRRQSAKIAFCGLISALAVVLMLSGGLIPVATYCAPMASAILLLPVLIEYGKKAAWTSYAAVSLIVLLLGVDKEAAFFYLFLGYYPVLKWEIEKVRKKPLRMLLKLIVFNVSIAVMYAVMGFVLNMDALVAEFTQMGAFLLALFAVLLNLSLLLYDRLLLAMLFLYANKLRPRLKSILS